MHNVFGTPGLRIALCTLVSLAVMSSATAQGRRSTAWLLRLADSNRDGTVAASEWKDFVARVSKGEALDTRAILSARIGAELDVDGDGVWSERDLAQHFESLDRDKNGSLSAAEVGRTATGGMRAGSVARVLARFADADRDGAVLATEWRQFLDAQRAKAKGQDLADLRRLLLEDEPRADQDLAKARPGAFTWKVALLTLESSLDIDGNGARNAEDLRAAFGSYDANADGALSPQELRASPRSVRRNPARQTRIEAGDSPLMPWQRSLEDALELQRRTGKPLLICVNVDGESACERLAAGRYRSESFAKLADGFICLLACPTRHSLRDYEDRGRRIVDPKFGRVTSYEHIAIEPTLFEKYFAGRRVAPRHVGIDRNGKRLFDIFLTGSLAPIDAALREHGIAKPERPAPNFASLAQLLNSPDAAHRDELEARFARGDVDARARIARRCLDASRSVQHPEVLRMALRDDSASVRAAAARAFATHPTGASVDYFPLAFARCSDAGTRGALLRGLHVLARVSEAESQARTRAIELLSKYAWGAVEAPASMGAAWSKRDGTLTPEPTPDELDALGESLRKVELELRDKAGDAALQLQRAFLNLRYARIRIAQKQNPSLFLDDAKDAARRALATQDSARGRALFAWAAHLSGDIDSAAMAAESALPGIASGISDLAASTLWISIDARIRGIYSAMRDKLRWPDAWTREIAERGPVLLAHPRASQAQASALAQFWRTLECYAEQHAVLSLAVQHFPSEGKLHEQLRSTSLYLGGAAGLMADYAKIQSANRVDDNAATIAWYRGFAAITAAERCVQNAAGQDEITACYVTASKAFDRSAELREDYRASAEWYQCLANSAHARVQAQFGNLDMAETLIHTACLLGTKARFAAKDGLGRTARASLNAALRLMRPDLDAETHALLAKSIKDAAARD